MEVKDLLNKVAISLSMEISIVQIEDYKALILGDERIGTFDAEPTIKECVSFLTDFARNKAEYWLYFHTFLINLLTDDLTK